MTFVQSDNVVEQFASATADPALGHAVLPRTLDGGLHSNHLHGPHRGRNFQPVLSVVVEDEEPRCLLIGKRFSRLLDNPGAGRMACNIEMENAPAVVADDEEAIQKVKSHGGYSK